MRILTVLLYFLISANCVFAYDYPQEMKNNLEVTQKINYNPNSKIWTRKPLKSGITFTKHMTVGSGGFSEFLNQKKYYDTNTTLEFLDENRLIGYNQHMLKFFELGFDGKKITNRELKLDEIKKLFPDVEIVKISDFKNNKIVLKKNRGETKTFLLINDTNKDFYKYSYEKHGNGTELIKSIIEVDKPKTILFSHFSSRDKLYPILTIKIRNNIFNFKKD